MRLDLFSQLVESVAGLRFTVGIAGVGVVVSVVATGGGVVSDDGAIGGTVGIDGAS